MMFETDGGFNFTADYKAGKKAAAGCFVGQVMKLSKGKADPKLVGKLVAQKLARSGRAADGLGGGQ